MKRTVPENQMIENTATCKILIANEFHLQSALPQCADDARQPMKFAVSSMAGEKETGGKNGRRKLPKPAAKGGGDRARGDANGEVREIRERDARTGPSAVERRAGEADLRKRVEGRLEDVDRVLENGDERVPAEPARLGLAENHRRADGEVLLRRRRAVASRIRSAEIEGLSRSRKAANVTR